MKDAPLDPISEVTGSEQLTSSTRKTNAEEEEMKHGEIQA